MPNVHTVQQKRAKRQLIMQVAMQLFAEQSYTQITMKQIADAAGMAKGTVFNYFATKEDLFMSVLLEDYCAFFTKIIEQVNQKREVTQSDFISLMISSTRELINGHAELVRLNAIRGPVLEGKANMAETIKRRNQLYAVSQELGTLLATKSKQLLTQGQFSHLFIIQSAIISGLMNMSSLASFNHQQVALTYLDFTIDLVAEAEAQMRYYLTGFFEERKHNETSTNS
ncbi:TetR/AcrR family transcriptional regulator [Lactobacillus sp. ESL0731]|uniref:TetR/AcrR family transcriptional regulator n=1 Tax=unclassified Lactobacillus TaxID=2620435 RepID=UPI0023F95FFE|nr:MULTISPECIES: TetR/AcrR family transcriptional regulator [unclassified Lactobacillus]WEV50904.1 TetR/AcrR family transcriptional regulator [Lactobacillus sp. ESL0700]WEV62035.1 TetR/AcrR family transcriptional regulator [Lactobacillus sp. ESL0731]